MSKVLKFDRKLYGADGLITQYRGDDWYLPGQIVERIGSYETMVDLSQYGVTGYFPSASGGPDLPAAAATGSCGCTVITLPAASTPLVQTNTGGEGVYVILQDSQGRLTTVPTLDQSFAVVDRGFPTG